MNEMTALLTTHSIEELILYVILVLFAIKVMMELFSYFFNKARLYFGVANEKELWRQEIRDTLNGISEEIDILKEQNNQTHQHQKEIDMTIALVQERLQESTRSYLIDTHHEFCYKTGAIDYLTLQSMERRYLYYKTAGGDSFIDGLMEDVRALPRLGFDGDEDVEYKFDGRKELH